MMYVGDYKFCEAVIKIIKDWYPDTGCVDYVEGADVNSTIFRWIVDDKKEQFETITVYTKDGWVVKSDCYGYDHPIMIEIRKLIFACRAQAVGASTTETHTGLEVLLLSVLSYGWVLKIEPPVNDGDRYVLYARKDDRRIVVCDLDLPYGMELLVNQLHKSALEKMNNG